jgi:hypothetical protein
MEISLSKMHCSHEGSFQGRKLGANGLHLFQHCEGPLSRPECLWALVESMNIKVAPFTRPGDVGVWKCSPIIHCNNFVPCWPNKASFFLSLCLVPNFLLLQLNLHGEDILPLLPYAFLQSLITFQSFLTLLCSIV